MVTFTKLNDLWKLEFWEMNLKISNADSYRHLVMKLKSYHVFQLFFFTINHDSEFTLVRLWPIFAWGVKVEHDHIV